MTISTTMLVHVFLANEKLHLTFGGNICKLTSFFPLHILGGETGLWLSFDNEFTVSQSTVRTLHRHLRLITFEDVDFYYATLYISGKQNTPVCVFVIHVLIINFTAWYICNQTRERLFWIWLYIKYHVKLFSCLKWISGFCNTLVIPITFQFIRK